MGRLKAGSIPETLDDGSYALCTVFETIEKRLIMAMAAFGGCFASFSASICDPILNTSAKDFGVSAAKVNWRGLAMKPSAPPSEVISFH